MAGIGCHYMAMWMDRRTETFTQMGGEGVSWLGQMHFSDDKHVFVNLGDGTYFHSGLLAIRAAIAAKANVTYKILYNDAVAMTGGQPVDGVLTVPQIAQQVMAEGASRFLIVSDEPEKYAARTGLPEALTVHHRDELDVLQLALRETAGVSILIYDQTCATEKRRRRKRGEYPDPARRAFINPAVCEGCGDCSVASNCLSVEPLETPLGTKRRINQSACNKDFSCLKGFCPSFVTAEGAQPRKPVGIAKAQPKALPEPQLPSLEKPCGIVVTGVGGTGVVTIGALLGMAAHLERKGVTVLDMTGLAQKGGAVLSHVQIAATPAEIHATRIATGEADVLIGCDTIVSASGEALSKVRHGLTRAVVNSAEVPTAEFLSNPNWKFPGSAAEGDIRASVGGTCEFIDANALALRMLGDTIYANPLVLGFAWQKGWIPLGKAALLRAIELNAVSVDKNTQAFEWGRLAAHDASALSAPDTPTTGSPMLRPETESLDRRVEERVELLTSYQNAAYARRYRSAVERVREVEHRIVGAGRLTLTEAVARNLSKLMAYKDEYEVARLHSAPEFLAQLRDQFEGEPGRDYQLSFHLAPPLIAKRGSDGMLRKRAYGPWMMSAFHLLARCKGLRGTTFDPFGHTAERRHERALVKGYFELVDQFCTTLSAANVNVAIELASLPEQIRGFGHVKERNLREVEARRVALITDWNGS